MSKPSIIIFTGNQGDFIQNLLRKELNIIGIATMTQKTPFRQRLLQPARWLYRRLVYGKVLPSLKRIAAQHQIEYFEYDKAQSKDFQNWLTMQRPDVLLLYHVPILNNHLLDIATLITMNLHPTLLPKYRGGHPLLWMAKDFDLNGGVSLHKVTQNVDCGDIIAQRSFDIPIGTSIAEVEMLAIEEHGVELVMDAMQAIENNRLRTTIQPKQSPTPYAKRLMPEEFWKMLDWQGWPINHCWHYLRAEDFWLSQVKSLPNFKDAHLYRIGDYQTVPVEGKAGSIKRDQEGLYFIHPAGKIRILQQHRWRIYWDKLLAVIFRRRNAITHI